MWVHFSDPHRPYQRHPDVHFGDRPVDLYDGEIHSADAAVGRVLRALTQAHLDDTTAVFVVADHGEEFGEHGGEAHGWDIYDELIHVPLVVRLPGSPVGRVRAHVTQRDLPFTITDLLGIGQPPPGEDHSLVPLLDARADDRAAAIGPLSSFDVGALMAGRWKLAYCLFNDSRALYDLAADPAERVNLFEARPQVARRMDELLRRFLADPAHVTPPLVADGELRW
jgi:arylsulfatase A-like enzyme